MAGQREILGQMCCGRGLATATLEIHDREDLDPLAVPAVWNVNSLVRLLVGFEKVPEFQHLAGRVESTSGIDSSTSGPLPSAWS